MRYMLDTNICIYAMKKNPKKVYEKLLEHEQDDICISSITYSELIYGVEKSEQKIRNRIALAVVLSKLNILPFDAKASEEFGAIRAELERSGKTIGMLDAMIAGHAKSLSCVLVTNNTKEFKRVKDLELENWV